MEVICTTDDPIDSLEFHKLEEESNILLLPTWRPDKIMAVEDIKSYNHYIDQLEVIADVEISSYTTLLKAVKIRHDYFAQNGCKISDHGIEEFYAEDYSAKEIEGVFGKVRSGRQLDSTEIRKFKSAMLVEFAIMNHDKNWVQQFHFGPIRNTNSKMYSLIGPDGGFDSMGDLPVAQSLSKFLNRLVKEDKLTKTVFYNSNPKDNDVLATMIGNFQDGSYPGKLQMGPGWWFLDQKKGMEDQLNSLSNHGLLSRFVGMLTDSRSFLSFSRHEYFRRILCNLLGIEMEKGLIPDDIEMTGQIVQDICYNNAKSYFEFM